MAATSAATWSADMASQAYGAWLGCADAHHGPGQPDVAGRTEEPAVVAEGEDAAVGGHQPVAVAVGGGRHAHHRLGEPDGRPWSRGRRRRRRRRCRRRRPPTSSRRRRGWWPSRPRAWRAPLRPVEPWKSGVAEGEDAAVGGHQPVAAPVGGGGHAHDGLGERDVARRAVEARIAEGEDAAVGGHQPVAARRRGWRPCPPRAWSA